MKQLNREFFLALTVFSKEIFGIRVGGGTLDVYQLLIAACGIVLYLNLKRMFSLVAVLAAIPILSAGLFLLYDYPITSQFIRQVLAVSFIFCGTAAYLLHCSPEKLAIGYFRVCYWAAIFGISQFCLSVVGIYILIKLPMRLDSFAAEPSHYAVAIAPCVYYCIRYHKTPAAKHRSAVILSSLALTISATAVAIASIAFAVAFYKRRGFFAAILLILTAPLLLSIPPEKFPDVIATRLTSMQEYAETDGEPWETVNLTTLSFATNFEIMAQTLADGRLLGNGFCGHSVAYYNCYDSTVFANHKWYGINAPAAHCLVIRIVSEFGLPGIAVLMYFIWSTLSRNHVSLWAMFCLMAIVARLFKLGSWIDYGMPLFLLGAVYFTERATVTSTSTVSHVAGRIRIQASGRPAQ